MSDHGYMVVVELYDPDDKRNPYEGMGFVVGPYPTNDAADVVQRELKSALLGNGEVQANISIFPAIPWWGARTALGDLLVDLNAETEEAAPAQRKKRVVVDQDDLLGYLVENGPTTMLRIAEVFDIHPTTAKCKLEGLVFQGKIDQYRSAANQEWIFRVINPDPQ